MTSAGDVVATWGEDSGRKLGVWPLGAAGVADEATHILVGRSQRVHDVPADEARPPGDEDQRVGSR